METLINQLVETVRSAGGSIEYRELVKTVDRADYANLPKALRDAKGKGLLQAAVKWDAATKQVSHTVSLPAS